ncbi:Gfo/Idh/MocA family protein [Desulfosporosinus meridiei]|uniref:Putative dehydrogenase n=1 Tax=Desulfosporosinus meridiei (strain ATCC BAA-275 / DSM 13257 / KCTC 12902 / NCIMB 13706 / S10) TaxID=768704 RepID=J7IW15_DESMD|nr:Gfo/Idh/MocA family oxidoreductase [Desulfosporosinus meridiei]AFQ45935.1 putative dehydrogenase [Desulfosporosinus meridiei DSM 13257]
MKKLLMGILGPSDVAFNRFLPALKKSKHFEYVGVAIAKPHERNESSNGSYHEYELKAMFRKSMAKADDFINKYKGAIFNGYEQLLSSSVEGIYIPLPPALHYLWAKKALECGKHVLLEKPFTTNLADTRKLLKLAEQKGLAVHENYAFCYHEQINKIRQLIEDREIGEIRQIRAAFGFPYRGAADFRYNKELGGGAVMDCGGYPIKLSTLLLGKTAQTMTASLHSAKEHNVDVFGSATLENEDGITAQVSFGMDNCYKCELEIWGSEGCIYAPRIFTAPTNLTATVLLKKQEERVYEIAGNDQFLGSIDHFYQCIADKTLRLESYAEIESQSRQIDDILKVTKKQGGNYESKIHTGC